MAAGSEATVGIVVLGVQSKGSEGTWRYVVQSTWVDPGNLKYEPCNSIRPGQGAEITSVASGIVLFKKQLADLGQEATLRFNLAIFCQQRDGKVLAQEVTTDAFLLRLRDADK